MAEVILGIGTSHSPMLSTPHEAFDRLGELDRGRLPEFAAKARIKTLAEYEALWQKAKQSAA